MNGEIPMSSDGIARPPPATPPRTPNHGKQHHQQMGNNEAFALAFGEFDMMQADEIFSNADTQGFAPLDGAHLDGLMSDIYGSIYTAQEQAPPFGGMMAMSPALNKMCHSATAAPMSGLTSSSLSPMRATITPPANRPGNYIRRSARLTPTRILSPRMAPFSPGGPFYGLGDFSPGSVLSPARRVGLFPGGMASANPELAGDMKQGMHPPAPPQFHAAARSMLGMEDVHYHGMMHVSPPNRDFNPGHQHPLPASSLASSVPRAKSSLGGVQATAMPLTSDKRPNTAAVAKKTSVRAIKSSTAKKNKDRPSLVKSSSSTEKRNGNAPKRGEYKCGKCGYFPKKEKHDCATEKAKRDAEKAAGTASSSASSSSSSSKRSGGSKSNSSRASSGSVASSSSASHSRPPTASSNDAEAKMRMASSMAATAAAAALAGRHMAPPASHHAGMVAPAWRS